MRVGKACCRRELSARARKGEGGARMRLLGVEEINVGFQADVNHTRQLHSFHLPDTSQPQVYLDQTSSNTQPTRSYPREATNARAYPTEG